MSIGIDPRRIKRSNDLNELGSSCVPFAGSVTIGAEPRRRFKFFFVKLGSRFSFWPGTIDNLATLQLFSSSCISLSRLKLSFLLMPNTARFSSPWESDDDEWLSTNVSGYVVVMSPVADIYRARIYGCNGGNVCWRTKCLATLAAFADDIGAKLVTPISHLFKKNRLFFNHSNTKRKFA